MWLLRKYPVKKSLNAIYLPCITPPPPNISPTVYKPPKKGLCHNISPGLNYGILRYGNKNHPLKQAITFEAKYDNQD